MSKIFDLNVIDPNPYQVRESEDPEHIKKLALSIAKDEMFQIPMGRKYDGRVQLAFGHSRLAAYKFLRDSGAWYGENNGFNPLNYASMPVEIRDLNDQHMFELAVQENVERKNLNPIEEARAMIVYRDHFGKNSEEIGKLFGNMSDSAVRNKMRLVHLVDLSPSLPKYLSSGEMLEGSARALLRLLDLDEASRFKSEDQETYPKPSEIIELAMMGVGQKRVTELIDELMAWLRPEGVKPIPGKLLQLPLEIPAPEPEPIPAPAPVEMPALQAEPVVEDLPDDGEAEEEERPQQGDQDYPRESEPAQEEHIAAPAPVVEELKPVQPVEEPRKATAAAPQAAKPAILPMKSQASVPAPAPQPAPAPAPVKVMTWRESTITLTLTFWPDDGNEKGRIAMIGARLNSDAPKMVMARQADLALPVQLVEMMAELNKSMGEQE